MPAAIDEVRHSEKSIALEQIVASARPIVLRGLCADWPLVECARQSDTAFAQELARHDNGAPVDALLIAADANGTIGYDARMQGFNYDHFRVSVTDVLQRLAAYSRTTHPRGVAMQSALIAQCLPTLRETLRLSLLPASVEPRLWIGNRVTTPAHFDSTHNIAVVVCGRRRFTLFPPEQVRNLHVGPLDFAPTAAAMSLARLDAVDDPRWPRLREALAHACVAELEPGDAIYIPPVWWHHVASLERLNALVNYWWSSAAFPGHVAEPGLNALMHAILAYRALPPAEREAWRTILDHYVFEGDAASHIPPERHGVLGALTPQTEAQLRERALLRP
ncbi:MAG: cupin-like domain-containing protein [Rudaea sp.]